MSEFSRLNAFKKSAFNTANLSGLAAVLFFLNSIANITCLYETRHALLKEKHF